MLWQQPRDSGHDRSCTVSTYLEWLSFPRCRGIKDPSLSKQRATAESANEVDKRRALGVGGLALKGIAEKRVDTYFLHHASKTK
jgi:hypothetical protein